MAGLGGGEVVERGHFLPLQLAQQRDFVEEEAVEVVVVVGLEVGIVGAEAVVVEQLEVAEAAGQNGLVARKMAVVDEGQALLLAHKPAHAHPEVAVAQQAQRHVVAHAGLQQQVAHLGPEGGHGQPALHVEGGPLRAQVELAIGPADVALAGPVVGRQPHGEHAAAAEVGRGQLVAHGQVGGKGPAGHVAQQPVGGVEELAAVEIRRPDVQIQAVQRLGGVGQLGPGAAVEFGVVAVGQQRVHRVDERIELRILVEILDGAARRQADLPALHGVQLPVGFQVGVELGTAKTVAQRGREDEKPPVVGVLPEGGAGVQHHAFHGVILHNLGQRLHGHRPLAEGIEVRVAAEQQAGRLELVALAVHRVLVGPRAPNHLRAVFLVIIGFFLVGERHGAHLVPVGRVALVHAFFNQLHLAARHLGKGVGAERIALGALHLLAHLGAEAAQVGPALANLGGGFLADGGLGFALGYHGRGRGHGRRGVGGHHGGVVRKHGRNVPRPFEAQAREVGPHLLRLNEPHVGIARRGGVLLGQVQLVHVVELGILVQAQIDGMNAPRTVHDIDEAGKNRVGAAARQHPDFVHRYAALRGAAHQLVLIKEHGVGRDGRHVAALRKGRLY